MTGPRFFQTPMGRKFYQVNVPNIIKQLNRIADALEEQNELEKRKTVDDNTEPFAPRSEE